MCLATVQTNLAARDVTVRRTLVCPILVSRVDNVCKRGTPFTVSVLRCAEERHASCKRQMLVIPTLASTEAHVKTLKLMVNILKQCWHMGHLTCGPYLHFQISCLITCWNKLP